MEDTLNNKPSDDGDELRDHYDLDYSKAKSNRFAALFNPGSTPTVAKIRSPRFAHPEQAAEFIKEIVEVPDE